MLDFLVNTKMSLVWNNTSKYIPQLWDTLITQIEGLKVKEWLSDYWTSFLKKKWVDETNHFETSMVLVVTCNQSHGLFASNSIPQRINSESIIGIDSSDSMWMELFWTHEPSNTLLSLHQQNITSRFIQTSSKISLLDIDQWKIKKNHCSNC